MTGEPDRNSTVFVVDDDVAMRDSLRLLLQTTGVSAKCFASAVEFLEFIKPHNVSGPVCLIADIQMPEVNGIELLQQLRASAKDLPVILITGHGDTALRNKAEELGVATFLEKPFRPDKLQKVVVTCLRPTRAERDSL